LIDDRTRSGPVRCPESSLTSLVRRGVGARSDFVGRCASGSHGSWSHSRTCSRPDETILQRRPPMVDGDVLTGRRERLPGIRLSVVSSAATDKVQCEMHSATVNYGLDALSTSRNTAMAVDSSRRVTLHGEDADRVLSFASALSVLDHTRCPSGNSSEELFHGYASLNAPENATPAGTPVGSRRTRIHVLPWAKAPGPEAARRCWRSITDARPDGTGSPQMADSCVNH